MRGESPSDLRTTLRNHGSESSPPHKLGEHSKNLNAPSPPGRRRHGSGGAAQGVQTVCHTFLQNSSKINARVHEFLT